MISFKVTPADMNKIDLIVTRAERFYREVHKSRLDRLALEMDVTACHANGCRLKLDELLAADDFNFAHDVFGIANHLDRKTGKLRNCFLPRFAA